MSGAVSAGSVVKDCSPGVKGCNVTALKEQWSFGVFSSQRNAFGV